MKHQLELLWADKFGLCCVVGMAIMAVCLFAMRFNVMP